MKRRKSALLFLSAVALWGCGDSEGLPTVSPTDDAWFQSEVISQTTPVLVDFGAEWCGPCRTLKPSLDKLAEKHAGKIKVVAVDVDERQELAAHYQVQGIPRLLLFKNGQVVAGETGSMPYEDLESWVLSHVD